MTKPEILLWLAIKADQLGVRFRRQYGIGRYITDFYVPRLRLVVELDGSQHYTPEGRRYDEIRTKSFESIGIQVIRFANDEVCRNLHGVLQRLRIAIADRQNGQVRSPSFQEGATGESQGGPRGDVGLSG